MQCSRVWVTNNRGYIHIIVVSGKLLITYASQLFPSLTLQIDAVK